MRWACKVPGEQRKAKEDKALGFRPRPSRGGPHFVLELPPWTSKHQAEAQSLPSREFPSRCPGKKTHAHAQTTQTYSSTLPRHHSTHTRARKAASYGHIVSSLAKRAQTHAIMAGRPGTSPDQPVDPRSPDLAAQLREVVAMDATVSVKKIMLEAIRENASQRQRTKEIQMQVQLEKAKAARRRDDELAEADGLSGGSRGSGNAANKRGKRIAALRLG